MKLRRLSIRRMPGFEDSGFTLPDLSKKLNIITGPNASGKTTACRSIQGLLWPETLSGITPVSLAGEWVEDGETLSVELEGINSTWQHDGVPCDTPRLPGSHLASCFTVTIDDLFAGSKTDAGLAERVVREIAGGYDLKALRNIEALRTSRSRGRKELKQLRSAKTEVARISDEQQVLRREEESLDKLEKQERAARTAQTRLDTLQYAQQLVNVRADIGEAEHILGEFPAGMELLHGKEAERLEQIKNDHNDAERDLQAASGDVNEALQLINDAQLPEESISDQLLEEHKTRLEDLRKIEDELGSAERRVREAEEKFEHALQALGETAESEKLDSIDLTGLDRLDSFYQAAESARAKELALQEKLGLLGVEKSSRDIDALVNGISILRQWLEMGHPRPRYSRERLILECILVGSILAIGIALALFVSPWWALLVLPAGVAGVAVWFLKEPGAVDMRSALEEQYRRLPVDEPQSWDRESLGKHVNKLERELAEAREAERCNEQRKDLIGQLDRLKSENTALERQRDLLVREFSVSPDTSTLALYVLAKDFLQYEESRTLRDTAKAAVEELEERHAKQVQVVNAHLNEYGEEECDSYDIARVRSDTIEKRVVQHRSAKTQLANAQKKVNSAQALKEKLQRRNHELFASVSLEDDDEVELQKRLAALSDYNEATITLKNLKADESALLSRLESTPEMLSFGSEEIDAETRRLKRMAEGYDDIRERIINIRSEIERAAKGSDLEDALAEVELSVEALAERRDEAILAAAGNFLLDNVESEYEVEGRPAVLAGASEWLGLFTQGRYEIRLDISPESESPAFRALDTIAGRGLAIKELSRGTRIQLLLAMRLAFASAAERETQLPFILDEILSSSDPARFRAIVECVLNMVENGRQVLYFTCQPSDAAAWQELAKEAGLSDVFKIYLTDALTGEDIASTPLTKTAVEVKRVPEPEDRSFSEYVTILGVPDIDPAVGAHATHVAHLVRDAEVLHRLLSAGIERYGQLESLASYGATGAYVDDNVLSQIKARACVLNAFSDAWQVGRGKLVSRDVLIAAGISDSFIDRITELARDLDWHAERLLEALSMKEDNRAKGFRSGVLARVSENLTESGYLDTREPLDEDAVLTRVLAALSDFVKQGTIGVDDVRSLCSSLWHLSSQSTAVEPRDDVDT